MKQLVCEGPCNPQLPSIDAAVRSFREGIGHLDGGKIMAIPDTLVAWLRTCKHTPHDMIAEGTARCQTCHTTRIYGYSPYAHAVRREQMSDGGGTA